jgi:uncharacterized protein (TIGR02145 family)
LHRKDPKGKYNTTLLNFNEMKKIYRITISALAVIGFVSILSNSCKKADDPATGIIDKDGNVYKTVSIGSQVWMAENLKATKYLNGDPIGTTVSPASDISTESTPKYQWPSNGSESNVSAYGRLYTWYAITDSRNVCPAGWRVPTNEEFTTLMTYLNGDDVAGGKLKETGTAHWISPNTGATNETGFTALPGGYRGYEGLYHYVGYTAYFWSGTEIDAGNASYRGLYYNGTYDHNLSNSKKVGFAVRCIKGN